MRVLTLREPGASLIGEKIKCIETRSWPTSYRGELYIHAGLTKVKKTEESFIKMLDGGLHYGTIFCKCNLVDCIYIDENFAESVKANNPINYACGDYTEGRYAWILEDIEYITPIPAKGQGLRRICSNVRGTNTVLNYPRYKQGLLRKAEGALDIF